MLAPSPFGEGVGDEVLCDILQLRLDLKKSSLQKINTSLHLEKSRECF